MEDDKEVYQDYHVSFKWYVDDVWGRCAFLTTSECITVLEKCHLHHDATVGMNWDYIDYWIDRLFPDKWAEWQQLDCEEQDTVQTQGIQK